MGDDGHPIAGLYARFAPFFVPGLNLYRERLQASFFLCKFATTIVKDRIMLTLEFIIRIFVAALLGGFIGLEREYREKAAGLRTHFLVALGSALFMIVSSYGFEGVLKDPNMRLDVSRIAAQVVSGIGFIGAGTIIFQKNAVRGLTTAAGVWVTAAIGLACGAGMYLLATISTILVLVGMEAFNYVLRQLNRLHGTDEEKTDHAA